MPTTTRVAGEVVVLRQVTKVRIRIYFARSIVIEASWRHSWPEAPTFIVSLGARQV